MMSKETMRNILKKSRDETKEEIKALSKGFVEQQAKVDNTLNLQFSSIQTQLGSIVNSQLQSAKTALKNKAETDARLKTLEDIVKNLKNTKTEASSTCFVRNSLQDAAQNYSDSNSDSSWKVTLAKDMFEHEHGLIIHGVRLEGHNEQSKRAFIKKFLKDSLKASEDVVDKARMKDVSRLGTDPGTGKPPPILVMLGHPTERNTLLPLSSNLRRGVDIDKLIPKLYLKTHCNFKRHTWDLKLLHKVRSQVVFEGYNIILRNRKEDDDDDRKCFW